MTRPSGVVVVGSLNVDLVLPTPRLPGPDAAVWLDDAPHWTHGGHAANCAWAAARARAIVHVVGAVGADADGDALLGRLAEGAIGSEHVQRLPGQSTGQVFIPTFDTHHFMMMSRGANDHLKAEHAVDAVRRLRPLVLVVCDPPTDVVFALLATRLAPVVVVAPGHVLLARAELRDVLHAQLNVDFCVVNQPEQALLTSAPPPLGRTLLVTCGQHGVEIVRRDGRRHLPAPEVRQDARTLGAGDAFLGGLCAALSLGRELPDAVAHGQLAAGQVLSTLAARG